MIFRLFNQTRWRLPTTIFVASLLLLSACAYRPNVQQGNLISVKSIESLHKGMSEASIQQLLGNPLLTNIYSDNRLLYVYTFKKGWSRMTETRLIIVLRNHRLESFWTDEKLPHAIVSTTPIVAPTETSAVPTPPTKSAAPLVPKRPPALSRTAPAASTVPSGGSADVTPETPEHPPQTMAPGAPPAASP